MIMYGGGSIGSLFAYCIQENGAPPILAEDLAQIKHLYHVLGRTVGAEDLSDEMAARVRISKVQPSLNPLETYGVCAAPGDVPVSGGIGLQDGNFIAWRVVKRGDNYAAMAGVITILSSEYHTTAERIDCALSQAIYDVTALLSKQSTGDV